MEDQIYHREEHEYKGYKIDIIVQENLLEGVNVLAQVHYNSEQDPRRFVDYDSWLSRLKRRIRGKSLRDRIDELIEHSEEWIDEAEEVEKKAREEGEEHPDQSSLGEIL